MSDKSIKKKADALLKEAYSSYYSSIYKFCLAKLKDDPSYLAFVDLNNDGYINAKDMLYINACKGLAATSYKYPQLIIT